jgi:hypothetical protein
MAEVTANPAPGVSLADARKLCTTAAEAVRKELRLSARYRAIWLATEPTGLVGE